MQTETRRGAPGVAVVVPVTLYHRILAIRQREFPDFGIGVLIAALLESAVERLEGNEE